MTEFLKLKKSNCKNCYKCIRHCPVKSIRFSGNQAHIVGDECILCGECFVVCPQNAKVIYDDTEKAKVILSSNKTVVASIAPSFVANYVGATIEDMEKALKKLGFAAVEETAIGATIVKKQYENIINENKENCVITSCCHSVNLMIRKHFPAAIPYLARVISPMQAHCKDIKKRYNGAKSIFIGPCISKKAEAESYPDDVDCVLTFEELTNWLNNESIEIEKSEQVNNGETIGRARSFPTSGGIIKSMNVDSIEYNYVSVDGLENCINAINDIIDGKLGKCFVEMSACSGSCIGGPVMEKSKRRGIIRDSIAINKYTKADDFDVSMPEREELTKDHSYLGNNKKVPDEIEIMNILRQMGKVQPSDELNCGSCGYNTCREKAIAVYLGKADLSMCLPFLKDKAESLSNNIFLNTPNGIMILNELLEVQQINTAALQIMNIREASDVLGERVIRILDPTEFLEVLNENKHIENKRIYLADYKKYVEETIVYDKNYHTIMCIMRDVTDEETVREKKENITRKTIEITDKVVEKQMRVVQEIASLLGETTAETKIALTKLKESLNDE